MPPKTDITGRIYGKLIVLRLAGKRGRHYHWLCQCDCGGTSVVDVASLNAGRTKSCGCSAGAQPTHGKFGTRVYNAWCSMLQRCLNPNSPNYRYYGKRGISVCQRWETFDKFLIDMGEPQSGQSLDRIDNDGNYEPGNCRWTTTKRQRRNTSNTFKVTHQDEETAFVDLWEKTAHESVSYSLAFGRVVRLGWPIEKALAQPPHHKA